MKYKVSVIIMIIIQPIYLIGLYCFIYFGQIVYMYIEYPQYYEQKQKTLQSNNADIVVIGNSRGKAGFIPDEFKGYSSINLSVGGSTPIIGYYTLKRYFQHNKPPKLVILSYSADYFMDPAEFFWQGAVKTKFLDFNEIFEILKEARELNDCKPFKNSGGGCSDFDVYKYFLDLRNFGAELSAVDITLRRYRANVKMLKELEESRGHLYYGRANGAYGNFSEVSFKEFKISPTVSHYLHAISTLAKQYNVKVVSYVMPYNETSSININNTFLQQYTHFYDTMQKEYGILSLNKPYSMPNEDFGDGSHLYAGAKEATHEIYNRLKEAELIN